MFLKILHLALLSVTFGDKCDLHHLQSCQESLQSVAQISSGIFFATTKRELLYVCSVLKESVECIEHMKHCFTPTQRKVFNHVFGARQFLIELCVPGPIQQVYLKHSPCYQNVSLSENKCAHEYRYLIQMSEIVDEQKNIEDGFRESCCAFDAMVKCRHIHARQDCGNKSAEFLQQYLDRISNPLIYENCEHYMYGSKSAIAICSSSLVLLIYAFVFLRGFVKMLKV